MAHVRNARFERIITPFKDYIKDDLKRCLTEGSIRKPYDENAILGDIAEEKEAIWSVLVNYGLLTIKKRDSGGLCELVVPNISVGFYIVELILKWENRILTPEQASSGDYTTIPTDPIGFKKFHIRMLQETLASMMPEESKTVPSSTSVSSHAAVSSRLSEAGGASVVMTAASTKHTVDDEKYAVAKEKEEKYAVAKEKEEKYTVDKEGELDKNFGNTLSGLRGAFSARR